MFEDGFPTFGSFDQLYVHDSLWEAPPAAYAESDETTGLLQCLHSPTVGHLPHIGVIHPNYAVIHPAEGGRNHFNYIGNASHEQRDLGLASQMVQMVLKI